MASTRLYRTFGTPTLATKYTCSFWMKRGNITVLQYIFNSYSDANNWGILRFNADDKLEFFQNASSSTQCQLITNRFFRDVGAWYHVVIGVDTTQGTPADRNKIYINGVQETSFSTETNFGSSDTGVWNGAYVHTIGRNADSGGDYFDGSMAHFHWIDGTQYAASDFGETDSTSGIWVAKTGPSVTYGNNGCFLKFQDAAAFGDDTSGNTNDFTVSGTMTNTKDTPDDNFCTLNPLDNYFPNYTYGNGNTRLNSNAASECYVNGTMALTQGKWYWEVKITDNGVNDNFEIGIADRSPIVSQSSTSPLGYINYCYALNGDSGNVYDGDLGNTTPWGQSVTTGDIVGLYMDLDNNKMYWAKNGTVGNSGTGISIQPAADTLNGHYFPATGENSGASETKIFDHNFGNGYFGTTAVSSAVADAGGIGQFEYDPSSGTFDGSSKDFRAICTSNIATYG